MSQSELPISRPDPSSQGVCRWCQQTRTLVNGVLHPHPTKCTCLGGHAPGRRCPAETMCSGSGQPPMAASTTLPEWEQIAAECRAYLGGYRQGRASASALLGRILAAAGTATYVRAEATAEAHRRELTEEPVPGLDVPALLRLAASGRRDYAITAPDDQAAVLETAAAAFDVAARIASGDYLHPLRSALPSRRWDEIPPPPAEAHDPGLLPDLVGLLTEAADALMAVGRAALTVKPTLAKPYTDAPDDNPWSRFMEQPARAAYALGVRIRHRLIGTARTLPGPDPLAALPPAADPEAR